MYIYCHLVVVAAIISSGDNTSGITIGDTNAVTVYKYVKHLWKNYSRLQLEVSLLLL